MSFWTLHLNKKIRAGKDHREGSVEDAPNTSLSKQPSGTQQPRENAAKGNAPEVFRITNGVGRGIEIDAQYGK